MWQIWLVAAMVFAIVEIFTPGFFSLSFSVGCLGAIIPSLLGLSLVWQVLIALGFFSLFVIFLRPLILKITNKKVQTNTERLIGMIGDVIATIKPFEKGRIKVDGYEWAASSNMEIHAGKRARITAVDGNTLHVEEV